MITINELISVIVPVYKVEKYLHQCVDSILNQTYKNLEIILVDDGSPDNCGKICDEYALLDNRVKVIHKENGGLSDARNYGMQVATGDVVSFIDSDDYISPYFYEIMYGTMQKEACDMVLLKAGTDFWDEDTDNIVKLASDAHDFKSEVMPGKYILELMLYQHVVTGAPFKLYAKKILEGVHFPVGLFYEDVATTYKALLRTDMAVLVTADIYAYRKRNDSIIRQSFSDKKLSALPIFDQLMNDKGLLSTGLHDAVACRVYSMLYSVFLQVPKERNDIRKKIWEKLKSARWCVVSNTSPLMRKKARYGAMISYLGMEISYWIGNKWGRKGTVR